MMKQPEYNLLTDVYKENEATCKNIDPETDFFSKNNY